MPSGTRPPNHRLAWERLQRGWSHEELRKQLVRVMSADGETDTGLTRNTVRRWETGARAPEPRYRKYLVLVFGKPADELGLLDPEELAMRPDVHDGGIDMLWRFVTMVGGGQNMDRETFLKGLIAFGAAPLLPSLLSREPAAHVPSRLATELHSSAAISAEAVADYEGITAAHRGLYWTAAPMALYGSVKSHVVLGEELVTKGGTDPLVRRLSSALGESAMLAGRIAFFDLKRPEPAQNDLRLALGASEASGDHPLAAAVLAHLSFVAAHRGDPASVRDLLAAAFAHSSQRTGPLVRAWLHAVEAEVSATGDDRPASLRALGRSESLLTDDGPEDDDPHWFDFFDSSRFAGFAGHTNLLLGRAEEARQPLQQSLDRLAPDAAKQRSVILADLAATYIEEDVEAACALTTQALEQLGDTWYATGFERVQAVRKQLTPHHQNRQVRELEDRLRSTEQPSA
jgi:transcriptional regulator with XRE-family HTH domain